MSSKILTWLLLASCVIVMVMSAPTTQVDSLHKRSSEEDQPSTESSEEDSSEEHVIIDGASMPAELSPIPMSAEKKRATEEKTTIPASKLALAKPTSPADKATTTTEKQQKRETEKQATEKQDSTLSTTAKIATRSTEEKQETQSPTTKPTEVTFDIKKDIPKPRQRRDAELQNTTEPYNSEYPTPEPQENSSSYSKQRRETEEKKDDLTKTATPKNKLEDGTTTSPIATTTDARSVRDVEGLGQPEKYVKIGTAANPGSKDKKDEGSQKLEVQESETLEAVAPKDSLTSFLPPSSAQTHERSKRQAKDTLYHGPQGRRPPPPPSYINRPGNSGKPQPRPTNNRPGNNGRPQNNRPGNNGKPQNNRPGYNNRPQNNRPGNNGKPQINRPGSNGRPGSPRP